MSVRAFVLAAACVAAALAMRALLGLIDPAIPPFTTFLAAVLVATIIAGVPAGAAAAVLSLALAWWAFAASTPHAFTLPGIGLYLATAAAIIWVAGQYRALLRRLQEKDAISDRQIGLIGAENDILAGVASGAPVVETLDRLARSVEAYTGGRMFASVLLMDSDGRRLRHGAAPSLPESYNASIDGLEIGPAAGSCGTAAFRKTAVYVTDIATDPLWEDYRELALSHGLRACWSTPLLSQSNTVLGTLALYHREPRAPTQQEMEIAQLMSRTAALAIAHDQGLKQRQLLVEELTHRVKNTLAVVKAIATTTLKPHAESDAYATFEARLIALAKAQNLLTQSHWSDVELVQLVNDVVVEPFAGGRERFQIEGPPIRFPARLTLPLALSLHELSTNAAKYGALSAEPGRVLIDWGWQDAPAAHTLRFRWREVNGPEVRAPERQGFGSRMIQQAFAAEPESSAKVEFRPEGLVCEISVPFA